MHRYTAFALFSVAGLALTCCSSNSEPPGTAAPSPSVTAYTIKDCKALLEKNLTGDNVHDVSQYDQCKHLTRDEYLSAVRDVLSANVDDIMQDAADEAVYDEIWDGFGTSGQQSVCDLLVDNGHIEVGEELDALVGGASVDTTKMAEYFYEDKCP
ncbi:DUF1587 domain-containing protein [Streptomyces coeruleorubidus]|uniref:DUF1587 domain-containing protein n=1 Tax=Streptomyces coeruleorubidus TaxID=116188 RepID=UPI0036C96502